jgi:hypothetical protein
MFVAEKLFQRPIILQGRALDWLACEVQTSLAWRIQGFNRIS